MRSSPAVVLYDRGGNSVPGNHSAMLALAGSFVKRLLQR